jgi:hypothetical protein
MFTLLRKYLRLVVFIVSLTSFCQKSKVKSFQLIWDMDKEVEFSDGLKLRYPLVEDNFIGKNGVPSFYSFWEVPRGPNKTSYSIENVTYETVDEKYLSSIDIESIPFELISSFNISRAPSIYGVSLSITPLIRQGNLIKKIVSFNLVYKLSTILSKSGQITNFEDSVLKSGTWYKFSIDKTGVFKIDSQFLSDLGVSTSDLDPRNIRIYGNGGKMLPNLNSDFRYNDLQENAIYVEGEEDAVFNENDYVLFYGQGPDDWNTDDQNSTSHRKNIYSDAAYYFLSVDLGVGKRIAQADEVSDPKTDAVTTYTDYLFKEDEIINLIGAGQQWFGDSFLSTNSRSYSFQFDDIDVSKDLIIKVKAASTASSSTSMNVSVNDNGGLFALNFTGVSGISKVSGALNRGAVSVESSLVTVNIEYLNNGNGNANAFLDYIELIGDKFLIASGKQFGFRNFLSKESDKVLEYTIQNNTHIDMLWDVTNAIEPKFISNEAVAGSNFNFKAKSGFLNEYHVLNNSNYYKPKVINQGPIANQNLHGLRNIQYLIITREDFVSQAERLASYHVNNSNLTANVVPLSQIYNEFGSGAPDVTAIRDFVKYLYDNASTDALKIKYLCTFGDSSYDYKIVPVYLAYESFDLVNSYVTDDYYGMMDSQEGEMTSFDKQDVATGRILASNAAQARIVVDKILNYYDSSSFGNWHNLVTLVSDDMDVANEFVFQKDLDAIAEEIKEQRPELNIKKIYSDAYVLEQSSGGNKYPDVNSDIASTMEKGSLLFNYFGHGGETGLASERIMTVTDIKSWNNLKKLPLFITITCDFTRFDNPGRFTGGEEMIVSSTGGSCSLISTTREVYLFYGRSFNKELVPNILNFGSEDYTISEALMHTKNNVQPILNQRFFIYYLGDPAMKLARPLPNIVVSQINDKDITQSRDTLKALSRIKISGEVQDVDGNVLNNFNGELSTVIYDKPTQRSTINNKKFRGTDGNPLIMDFEVQENTVFRGQSLVEDGIFNFELIVPKDIKLSYGEAKISFFVKNTETTKGGYDLATVIGGINEDAEPDLEGPSIELYMNDESFLDGGTTNETPKLIAKFSDVSGINTSSGSIGHSISAVIDGDEANPIILNEFYEAETADFTNGSLDYILSRLDQGSHTIKLKVWDTYNNASDKTLSFTVTESSQFILENVLNYPNPFIDYTEFWFTHNQPNELLNVRIYIYTASGELVKTITDTIETQGGLSRSITWDAKDNSGESLEKGVYVYKLEVENVSSGVKAEKLEKLVLLQ